MRLKIQQENLLSPSNSLRRFDFSGTKIPSTTIKNSTWTADSPATFSVVEDFFYRADRYSLKLTNSSSQNTIIRLTQTQVKWPHIKEELVFNAMVHADAPIQVSTYLHPPAIAYTSVTPNTQILESGIWNAIFSNPYTFGNDDFPYADTAITVVLGTQDSGSVYFSTPCLTLSNPDEFNQISQNSRRYLPDIIKDVDDESENPRRPVAKIFHSLTADMSHVIDKYIQMTNLEHAEVGHGDLDVTDHPYNVLTRSELTDPELMLPEYLDWGAMLVGARLVGNLYADGTAIHDTDEFDFRRWQVRTKTYGHAAGTRASVKEAVKTVLTGKKLVLVTPVYEGDPWVIGIRTLNTETPDAQAVGTESVNVLAAAEPARPAGFVFVHESVDTISFILDSSDFGVFDQNVLG